MTMTRTEAIICIDTLYPADSEHDDVARAGMELLDQAKRETASWRNEPTEVLIRYAQLCMEKEEQC